MAKKFAAYEAVKRCPRGTKLNSPATVNDAGGGYEFRDDRCSGRKVRNTQFNVARALSPRRPLRVDIRRHHT